MVTTDLKRIDELVQDMLKEGSFFAKQYTCARERFVTDDAFVAELANSPALRAIVSHIDGRDPELTPEQKAAEKAEREQRAQEMHEREAERVREARRDRLQDVRCSDAMRDALISKSFEKTAATEHVGSWLKNKDGSPWLVLSGPVGCGKTMAAYAAVAANGGIVVRADEVVRLFWANFGESYERQQELRDTHMLVVDDIGCELDAARMLPALLDLLDARVSRQNHPTIATTNLNAQAFKQRYDNARLHSRLVGLVYWVGLTGEDLRRRK